MEIFILLLVIVSLVGAVGIAIGADIAISAEKVEMAIQECATVNSVPSEFHRTEIRCENGFIKFMSEVKK